MCKSALDGVGAPARYRGYSPLLAPASGLHAVTAQISRAERNELRANPEKLSLEQRANKEKAKISEALKRKYPNISNALKKQSMVTFVTL